MDFDAGVQAGEPLAEASGASGILAYDPGQDYTFLGGTDATTGNRLYLGGYGPHTLRLSLRARRGG